MNTTLRRHTFRLIAGLAAGFVSGAPSANAQQTAPQAVPVPFASFYAGNGTTTPSTACTANVLTTSGTNVGDGCLPAQAAVSAPQGVSTDSYGNVYFADYNNKLVRVVYNGNPKLAAAITAANSGFSISASRSSNNTVPVVGNIYTIAGGLSAVISGSTNYCANYAGSGQTVALNTVGDGCPGAATYVGSRAVTTDADGNIFIADYVNSRIRVLCVDCSAGKFAQQLITTENPSVTAPLNGYIYPIAGYTGATNSSTGSGGANGFRDAIIGNNTAASDSSTGSMMREPTGIAVDAFDDIYIADQGNNAIRVLYNQATGGSNPLASLILATESGNTTFIIGSGSTGAAPVAVTNVTKGYLYTLAGTACHIGTSSGGSSSYVCLAAGSAVNNLLATKTAFNTTWGLTVDAGGNVYIGDGGTDQVRVIYGGVSNPLTLPNAGTTTLTLGNVYLLSGNGTVTQNGVTAYNESYTAPEGLGFDTAGNLYVSDTTKNILFEIYASTGLVAQIAGNASVATPAANLACNGTTGTLTGPIMNDAFGDNCPATQAKFAAPRGNIAFDPQGNILFTDNSGNNIRKLSYNTQFPNTATTATSATQPQAFTFMSAQTLSATPVSFSTLGNAGTDFIDAGSDTCTASLAAVATASATTCVVNVKFSPVKPGLRKGAAALSSATARIGSQLLSGNGLGAGLAVDPGISTAVGTSLTPNGITVDESGNVYIADPHSGSIVRYTATTPTPVATGFITPSGIALDGQGNLFVADTSANTVSEIPVQGTKFILTSAVSSPHGVATGGYGDLYIADTAHNRIVTIAPSSSMLTALPFTGLSAPQGVAVDAAGNVFVADTGNSRVVKLSNAGVQTAVAGISVAATGIALDAADDIYLTTGVSAVVYPAGSTTAIALTGSLTSPQAIALDSAGNAYIADSAATGFLKLFRTAGGYTFGASPTTATLLNIGTAVLTLTGTPFYTQTDSVDFAVASATVNGCATTLTTGTDCELTANYTPHGSGAFTDTITFASNAVNATPITFTLNPAGIPVTPLVTTTTLSIDAASVYFGHTSVLTATVTSTSTAPSDGSIVFKSGTVTLGSANVNTSGIATLNTALPVGLYPSLAAIYTPTSNTYASSTSTQTLSITVNPPFGITSSTLALTMPHAYQQATANLSITPGGSTNTLTFACTGLPAQLNCSFSPTTLALSGLVTPQAVVMTVSNSNASAQLELNPASRSHGIILGGLLLAIPAALLLWFGATRKRSRLGLMFALLLGLVSVSAGLTGCGDSNFLTPSGSYNFQMTASSGSTVVQTLNYTLTVQ